MSRAFDTDVLIVGAGPAGLSLATELTMRGHRVRVIEKNDRTGIQPRAKTTNVRTMTQMRRWGLAEEVRRRSPLKPDFPRRVSFQLSPFHDPVHSFEDAFCATPRKRDEFPEHAEFIPQYVIEGILAEHVAAHPLARLEFGLKMSTFVQDAEGVTARVAARDGSHTQEIRARFIVGADGGRSTVRDVLGIGMRGKRDIAHFVTLILRMPGLIGHPDLRQALFHWIIDPDATCLVGPMEGDLWFFGGVGTPDTRTEDLMELARRGLGRPVDMTLETRDDWVVHSLIADCYLMGRAFLAGDACHLHSPFGGHGMNLGIGDAVDLGWKLSAAVAGWGSDGLLDSYEIERRQVHLAVIESATKNVASLAEDFADPALKVGGPAGDAARARVGALIEDLKAPEFRSLGLVLGYRYGGSPAIAPAADAEPPLLVSEYRPTARPGHLAPHAWIGDRSLYDLFGPGFTLLCLDGTAGTTELARAAADAGVPLRLVEPEGVALDRLYSARFCLIRPDQHVAWRGDAIGDTEELVRLMRGTQRAGEEMQHRRAAG